MNTLIVFVVVSCVFMVGCSNNETEIKAERFCELYNMPIGTMSFSKYIGVSDGKAYIEAHRMSTLGSKEWTQSKYWANEQSVRAICRIVVN